MAFFSKEEKRSEKGLGSRTGTCTGGNGGGIRIAFPGSGNDAPGLADEKPNSA